MQEIQLGVIEARYADMIWEREPVTSSELVKLTAVEFNWKRTTAHNVLRRLCDKGLFRNDNGVVTSVISREEFYSLQSRKYVEDSFDGSLPAFIAAFTKGSPLRRRRRKRYAGSLTADRRCEDGRSILESVEYEHRGKLADTGGNRSAAASEESAEMDSLHFVGDCGCPADLPGLL